MLSSISLFGFGCLRRPLSVCKGRTIVPWTGWLLLLLLFRGSIRVTAVASRLTLLSGFGTICITVSVSTLLQHQDVADCCLAKHRHHKRTNRTDGQPGSSIFFFTFVQYPATCASSGFTPFSCNTNPQFATSFLIATDQFRFEFVEVLVVHGSRPIFCLWWFSGGARFWVAVSTLLLRAGPVSRDSPRPRPLM